MMLVHCTECENACSENARACPKCGNPLAGVAERPKGETTYSSVFGPVFAVIGAFFFFLGEGWVAWGFLSLALACYLSAIEKHIRSKTRP